MKLLLLKNKKTKSTKRSPWHFQVSNQWVKTWRNFVIVTTSWSINLLSVPTAKPTSASKEFLMQKNANSAESCSSKQQTWCVKRSRKTICRLISLSAKWAQVLNLKLLHKITDLRSCSLMKLNTVRRTNCIIVLGVTETWKNSNSKTYW